MPAFRFRSLGEIVLIAACVAAGAGVLAAQDVEVNVEAAAPPPAVELAPPFTPPPIQPTLLDWLTARPIAVKKELAKTDPLLRPPFAAAPVDTPKGLAAKIKAIELDSQNRIEAVRYLGTVDCVAFPEAQAMLIQVMQEDPFEPVRYEAVMALRMMLARGSAAGGNPDCDCEGCEARRDLVKDTKKHAHKAKIKCPENLCELWHQCLPKLIHAPLHAPAKLCKRIKNGKPEEMRYDYCRGCCSEEALNALSAVAYGRDEFGCWLEPSARVRQAAEEALQMCPCIPAPPTYPDALPEPVPPVPPLLEETPPQRPLEEAPPTGDEDEEERRRRQSAWNITALPAPGQEVHPAVTAASRRPVMQPRLDDAPILQALNGYCVVALKEREFVKALPDYSSVYKGRTYYFSCREAKELFDASPRDYAPAYAGFDPVEYVRSRQFHEGAYLREYNGQFYLFAAKENWDEFRAHPERYAMTAGGDAVTSR